MDKGTISAFTHPTHYASQAQPDSPLAVTPSVGIVIMEHAHRRTCNARRLFVLQGWGVTRAPMVHPTAVSRMVEVGVPSITHRANAMYPLDHLLHLMVVTCALFHLTQSATVALGGILGAAGLQRLVVSRGSLHQVSNIYFSSFVCVSALLLYHTFFCSFIFYCTHISLIHIH
jgi:hypothetical protein